MNTEYILKGFYSWNSCSSFYQQCIGDHKQLQAIADSLKKIGEQSFYDSPLFTALTGALFAAVAAFFFNYFHWVLVKRKDNICSLTSNIKLLISELNEVSVSYWLEAITSKADRTLAQECKIKALLRLQISYYNLLKNLLQRKSYLNKHKDNKIVLLFDKFLLLRFVGRSRQRSQELDKKLKVIYENMTKVFELVSGENFGASSREGDHVRASKISFACAQLDVQLSEILYGS